MNLLATLSLTTLLAAGAWDLSPVEDQNNVEFLTVVPDEGEHWSTVWFVVLDDAVYLRLGPRGAGRVEKSSTAPRMKLRFSDERVYDVQYAKVPEMAERVADAMYEKYWTDVFGEPFRKLGLSAPPVFLRVVPAEPAAAP
jgi:hypothetical protein